ncbi:MAG TPA: hypothetical protein VIC28_12330, partial [Thermoanaerobaculia bacterium]
RAGDPPLDVDFVVGTSGGALLGYFVARLAEGGPWNLSDVLWQNKEEKILDSTDIFGWTDLPRYLSVVAIFLVFSFLLFLSSAILRSISVEPPASEDFWRPRLTLAIVPLLLLTPVLIRWVNGRHAQEHIPEIEGLFFAICTCAALFADQCLVYRREPRPNGKLPIHPVLPLLLGLALVVVPLLPVWNTGEGDRWLDRPVSFLSAFLIFVLLGVGGALILPRRLLQSSRPFGRRLALAAAELCGAALLALPLLFLPASLWSRVGKLPFFLVGFALMLLVVGANPRLRQRSEQLAVASRRGGYYLGLFTAACLVLLLCRPDDMSTGPGLGPLIFRESRLNLPGGSLLICLGILSLLVAGMLWTYASRHYRLEEVPGFRAGFTLSLFLVFAVYLVLGAVMIVRPNMLSPLELTMGFWKWLLVTSLVLGLVILFTSRAGRGSRWSRRVSCGLSYLCSHHPNSSLVSRRYLRIAVLGIGSFLWWNFVLAPALYGNAHARGFLTVAEGRFHREYERGNPRQDAHRLTANLLVPANVLERDGTRFFLVVPGQIPDCPPISSKPGSGALWYTYRIEPPVRTEVGVPLPGCPNFRQRSPEDVEEVIFASGSPFPIFPAHLVELSDKAGKAKWQALVDGGYSNNEPVDAALNVSAEQVLIVESTNPLGPATAAESGASRLSMLVGPLVADLLRLPGFLFERSQQVDRLSRRGLFVVSLSPSRDATDWPPLFDFRRQVVEHLRETARQDLARRIGLVESWGPPRFQLSVLIGSGY